MPSQPSKSAIARAKGAQAKRLGSSGSGQRKRCKKGKSCGSSCIYSGKVCLVDLSTSVGPQVTLLRNRLGGQPYTVGDRGGELNAKEHIKRILNEVSSQSDSTITNGVVRDKDVNWRAALNQGVSYVGGGAFGQFVTVPAGDLVRGGESRFPDGVGVKSGEIGKYEVEALRRAGQLGVGPQLIAARVSSRVKEESSYPEGVIAMSKVPGKRLSDLPASVIPERTSDRAVMLAASVLHKAGISHNDMHSGNIYADANGRVRFVDFGMARTTPKHALAEAMRQFRSLGNLNDVQDRLLSLGVTPQEFRKMMVSFGDYVSGGGWDKITDSQALSLINTFYRGIQ